MTPAQRTGAILAGLRLLERALDEYDGPESRQLHGVGGILTNEGAHEAPSPQEIGALCEEINTKPAPGDVPRIPLDELEWRDCGEDRPRTRLLSTIQIGPVRFHLEAYLSEEVDSVQQFRGDYGDTAEQVYAAIGADGAWETVTIEGREYVLIATPYGA